MQYYHIDNLQIRAIRSFIEQSVRDERKDILRLLDKVMNEGYAGDTDEPSDKLVATESQWKSMLSLMDKQKHERDFARELILDFITQLTNDIIAGKVSASLSLDNE